MKRTIKQLKSSIRRKRNRKIKITQGRIKYWWKFINEVCFDNQLREPEKFLVIDGHKKENECWGYCLTEHNRSRYKPVTIAIAEQTGKNFLFFISILFHEMVHQWQQQEFGRMSHSKERFLIWSDIAEYLNIPFAAYHEEEDFHVNNNISYR